MTKKAKELFTEKPFEMAEAQINVFIFSLSITVITGNGDFYPKRTVYFLKLL